jgi:hypothetical protein
MEVNASFLTFGTAYYVHVAGTYDFLFAGITELISAVERKTNTNVF